MSPYTKRRRKALMSYFYVIMTVSLVSAQQPDPRWGQAWTMVGSKLYVHGGKKDPTSSYSYSAAPNTAEMLSLDLSSSFQTTAAPWVTVNSPSSPAVAFHSLAPFSSSQLLLFGGDGGPQLPIATRADSAFTLDTNSNAWSALGDAAAQPVRRLYSQAVYSSGKVWLTGGEKGDDSGIGYQEAFTFDSKIFSQLPTTDGPPDIVGHVSLVSSSGQLIVLGGFSPSLAGLLAFNSSYVLDTTTSTPKWSKVTLTGDVPPPRRDFAAAMLDGDQILIHGGSDASHQTVLSDGAVLDLKTGTWKSAPQLTEGLGARFGHTAAGVGSQALFSFGYSSSGPAPSSLLVYDAISSQFTTSYKPPTPPPPPASSPGTSSSSPTGLPNAPPSTPDIPNSTPTSSGGQSITTIALGTVFGMLALVAVGSVVVVYYVRRRRRGSEWSEIEGEKVNMIGVSSGWRQQGPRALGLFSLGGKTEDRRRIDMLADEDDRHFDVDAMRRGWPRRETSQTSTSTQLGIGRAMYNVSGAVYAASVSSLRSVGAAFGGSTSRRGGSAHSRNDLSSSSAPMTPGWWEKEQVQMDPFDDIHGARQAEAANNLGAALLPSGATVTHFDPTGTTVGMDPAVLAAAAAGTSVLGTRRNGDRPLPRRDHSNTSSLHSQGSSAGYNPFSDAYARRDFGDIEEESERGHQGDSTELDQLTTPSDGLWQSPFAGGLSSNNPLSDPPPASTLPQRRNPAGKPQLIPLTPVTSKDSSTVRTVYSHHTHEDEVFSPIESATPGTSADHHHNILKQPESPRRSQSYVSPPSLSPTRPLSPVRPISPTRPLSQQPPPQPLISLHGSYVDDDEALPVKRSDSFWSRFSRDAFRHRTNSQSSRRGEEHHPLDFRDPNPPPPRLGAIEEISASSTSPESSHIRHVSSKAELAGSARDGSLMHKKSVSSAMTADSEMLERMVTGGDMQVVQRVRTASSHHHGSATGPSTPLSAPSTLQGGFRDEIVTSPIETSPADFRVTSKASFDPRPGPKAGAVAQRVQAYERRMSIDTSGSPPPPTTAPKRPSTTYGLVPKPKLFVANTSRGGSDDSQA